MIEDIEPMQLLIANRNELVAQRVVLLYLCDKIAELGGPDRDKLADQLLGLGLYHGATGERDAGAHAHLVGICTQLRAGSGANVIAFPSEPENAA